MLNSQVHGGHHAKLADITITTAVTAQATTAVAQLSGMNYLVCEAIFTRTSGGTTTDAWVQTSLDGGTTWIDIMQFSFATTTASKVSAVVSTTALAAGVTPGDGSLAANSILSGLLGDRLRVKYTTAGTYGAGSGLVIWAVAKA